MKNSTLKNYSNNEKKAEKVMCSPKQESVNLILAYSKSTDVKSSELLNESVKMNLN